MEILLTLFLWWVSVSIVIICLDWSWLTPIPLKTRIWRNVLIGIVFAFPIYGMYEAGEANLARAVATSTTKK